MKSLTALTYSGLNKVLDERMKYAERVGWYSSLSASPEGKLYLQDLKGKKKNVIGLYKEIAVESPQCALMLGVLQEKERFLDELISNFENASLYQKQINEDIAEINAMISRRKQENEQRNHLIPTEVRKKLEEKGHG